MTSRIDAVQQARRERVAGLRQWEEKSPEEAIRTLIAAYRANPANFLIFQLLMSYAGQLDQFADNPAYRELLAAIDRLPIPPAPSHGASRAQMVDMLKSLAREAIHAESWEAAAVYLSQAREFAPDDPHLPPLLDSVSKKQKPIPSSAPATNKSTSAP